MGGIQLSPQAPEAGQYSTVGRGLRRTRYLEIEVRGGGKGGCFRCRDQHS